MTPGSGPAVAAARPPSPRPPVATSVTPSPPPVPERAGLGDRAVVGAYRAAFRLARSLPEGVTDEAVAVTGRAFWAAMPGRRRMAARHLQRVCGPDLTGRDLRRATRRSFESYARYYLESFRLPGYGPERVDAGFTDEGTDALWRALDDGGRGAILALPHLGGWEWAASWLTTVRHRRVAAVVEPLAPPALFEWFRAFRRSLGMTIIPLGAGAARDVLAALDRNEIVCLLCDRDLDGTGIPVEFFGERTTLPGGPALLGMRSGAPVFPTAVYFQPGGGHLGAVRPALHLGREGRLRDDVARHTQTLAAALEALVRAAPDQWHLFQPNWPSDHEWLAGAGTVTAPGDGAGLA